jgi:hypothetical protein
MKYIGIDPGVHEFAYGIIYSNKDVFFGFNKTSHDDIKNFCNNILEKFTSRQARETILIEIPDRIEGFVKPKDIINLATVTGELIGYINSYHITKVLKIMPNEWKGQQPKNVTKEKVLKIIPKLEEMLIQKKIPKSKRHHIYDAFGLICWYTNA